MNLHSARFFGRIAIWLHANGRNGRPIGTHLWVLDEDTMPTQTDVRQPWQQERNWVPPRFSWRPYALTMQALMRQGYVRPLCGHPSRSRNPYVGVTYGNIDLARFGCTPCVVAARRSGIVPLTYSQATEQHPLVLGLAGERAAWEAAGRPGTWPPSS